MNDFNVILSNYELFIDYMINNDLIFQEIDFIFNYINLFHQYVNNIISFDELNKLTYEMEDYFYINVYESTHEYDDLIVNVVNILEGNERSCENCEHYTQNEKYCHQDYYIATVKNAKNCKDYCYKIQ